MSETRLCEGSGTNLPGNEPTLRIIGFPQTPEGRSGLQACMRRMMATLSPAIGKDVTLNLVRLG